MDTHDTLELVLTYDYESLGKVSSTSKEWNTITGEYRNKEKMKYIKASSLSHKDNLIQQLDFEMYRCGSAYVDDGLEIYDTWRDDIDDWEEEWYCYRYYSFFYKGGDDHPLAHPHLWFHE